MVTPEDITKHHVPDPVENPWVRGEPQSDTVELVVYDPLWPGRYNELASQIRQELGDKMLDLEHVGSTAVPGLAAKDVIDIDLTVADSSDERHYVPDLEAIGYELTIREPSWHEHRMLRLADPRVNLHVFGPESPELIRYIILRDWLRDNPSDRQQYEEAKLSAITGTAGVMNYNRRKEPIIREIHDRAFRFRGLI